MSLSSFFRDYVYIPLGGSRVEPILIVRNLFITWFLTGMWHSASWNFILWGLFNGFFLLLAQEMEPLYRKFYARFPQLEGNKAWNVFRIVRTFLFVSALCMFDYYANAAIVGKAFLSMFTTWNLSVFWDGSLLQLGLTMTDYIILALSLVVVFVVSFLQEKGVSVRETIAAKALPIRVAIWYGLFLAVILFGAYGIGYDASQFIYNQF